MYISIFKIIAYMFIQKTLTLRRYQIGLANLRNINIPSGSFDC